MMLPNHAQVGHPFKTPNKIDQMGFSVGVLSGRIVSDFTPHLTFKKLPV